MGKSARGPMKPIGPALQKLLDEKNRHGEAVEKLLSEEQPDVCAECGNKTRSEPVTQNLEIQANPETDDRGDYELLMAAHGLTLNFFGGDIDRAASWFVTYAKKLER